MGGSRSQRRAQIAALLTLVNNVGPRRVRFSGLRQIDVTGREGKQLIIKDNCLFVRGDECVHRPSISATLSPSNFATVGPAPPSALFIFYAETRRSNLRFNRFS